MRLADAALRYYDAGYSVFPLRPRGKTPATRWGDYVTQRPTRAQVVEWWTKEPNANIALLTGQVDGCGACALVVVDVDVKGGGNVGDHRFVQHGVPTAKTQSGGRHFFFRHPGPTHRVKSCARPNPRSLPGVDIRGDGGYVVAAPSIGAKGAYTWEHDLMDTPLQPWGAVASLFTPETPSEGPVNTAGGGGLTPPSGSHLYPEWVQAAFRHVAPGSQRHELTRLAGYFAKRKISLETAQSILRTVVTGWPRGDAKHPWLSAGVDACVASIYAADEAANRGVDPDQGRLKTYTVLEFMDQFSGRAADWVVEEWLPAGGVGLVVAPPQTYKTWLLLDLALSVATGQPFLGRYAVHTSGPVLFINAEDPPTVVADRFGAIAVAKLRKNTPYRTDEGFDPDELDNPVRATPPPVVLSLGDGLNIGASGRAALRAEVERTKPVLVIMDPLYAFAGQSDGYFKDAANFLAFCKTLRAKHGTAFLVAHHTKKQNKEVGDQGREQMWGSNLLSAASEVDWQVRRFADHAITVQRYFKVMGGKERTPFSVDIDDTRIPPLKVEEMTEEQVASARAGEPPRSLNAAQQAKANHVEVVERVLTALRAGQTQTSMLTTVTALSRATVSRVLVELEASGVVVRDGDGPNPKTRWRIV